jgi:hypothetical protein
MCLTGSTKYCYREEGQPATGLFVCGAQLELSRITCFDRRKQ